MLAHCNVAYSDWLLEPENTKTKFYCQISLVKICKTKITTENTYKQNLPTSPVFIISNERDFEEEKEKTHRNIQRVQQLGREAF